MTRVDDLELRSGDRRFGLLMPGGIIAEVLRRCRDADGLETGGVLVGKYTDALDCAVVTHASGAPTDSRRGRAWFRRGTRGLQRWLDRLWGRERLYYLGEWHFHPGAEAEPSGTDRKQMQSIAESEQYLCPQPVLLIIGSHPAGHWEARAFVYQRGGSSEELLRVEDSEPAAEPSL